MSFIAGMKDKRRSPASPNVLHNGDEGQKENPPRPKMSFITRMKDKRGIPRVPNVFHNRDEGQKESLPRPKCLS
ncbi:hypothetical protein P421_14775 [Heyndrickxia coagulans P38]|nr:hypothetical protein P421_14775 [Heyndrickxia coagulans P38]